MSAYRPPADVNKMLKYLILLAFGFMTSAAHGQCRVGASATNEARPAAVDLDCLRTELQSSFLPRSGGTITGALSMLPSGTPMPVGDNTTTMDFKGGRVNVLRQIVKAVTNTPNEVIQLDNFSRMPLASYGLYPQLGALLVSANEHPGGTASMDAGIFSLNLLDNNPYAAQDVAIQSIVNQSGSDSTWLFDGFSRDLTGMPPHAFSQVGAEFDMEANGPDAPTASYDPLHTYRLFLSMNAGVKSWPGWEGNHAYAAGSVIVQRSATGTSSVYLTAAGGKSGANRPVFPDSKTVADGDVTWAYSQPFAVEYGRGIWLEGGLTGKNVSFGSGFASDARFQDAPIDVSEASLADPASAGIRLAAKMPIDFSGDGTALGRNLHVLQYADAALT